MICEIALASSGLAASTLDPRSRHGGCCRDGGMNTPNAPLESRRALLEVADRCRMAVAELLLLDVSSTDEFARWVRGSYRAALVDDAPRPPSPEVEASRSSSFEFSAHELEDAKDVVLDAVRMFQAGEIGVWGDIIGTLPMARARDRAGCVGWVPVAPGRASRLAERALSLLLTDALLRPSDFVSGVPELDYAASSGERAVVVDVTRVQSRAGALSSAR